MSSYHVVGANGTMSLPAGWTLPIIQEGDICRVVGDGTAQGFPAGEIAGFEQQGMIRLFRSPVEFKIRDAKQELAVETEYSERLFSTDLYVLYFDQSLFERVGIDIGSSLTGRGKIAQLSNGDGAALTAYVVGRRSLIHALEETSDRLDHRVIEHLVKHDWASNSYLENEDLKLLAKCLYDLAFNRSCARQAIVRRGLVIHSSRNCDMLEQWLVAASRRWGFSESLDFWLKRMRGLMERCITSDSAQRLRLYAEMLAVSLAKIEAAGDLQEEEFMAKKTSGWPGSNRTSRVEDRPGATVSEDSLLKLSTPNYARAKTLI